MLGRDRMAVELTMRAATAALDPDVEKDRLAHMLAQRANSNRRALNDALTAVTRESLGRRVPALERARRALRSALDIDHQSRRRHMRRGLLGFVRGVDPHEADDARR